MANREWKRLGEFEVESGILVVSDPCYNLGSNWNFELENVKCGIWEAFAQYSDEDDFGIRIAALGVKQIDQEMDISEMELEDNYYIDDDIFDWINDRIGVDSVQVSIVDKKYYRNDEELQDYTCDFTFGDSKWYNLCCNKSLSEESAGMIPGGVVSESGFGDGCYEAALHVNGFGKIDMVTVYFIGDEEEGEEER